MLNIVLLFCAFCLSLTLWCQTLYFVGYEVGDTASHSLYELPLLFLYAPFIRGYLLASIAIGITMAITGAIWTTYLYHIATEAINGQPNIGHVLSISLLSVIVLMKIIMTYTCALSPSFRTVLRDVRGQYQS